MSLVMLALLYSKSGLDKPFCLVQKCQAVCAYEAEGDCKRAAIDWGDDSYCSQINQLSKIRCHSGPCSQLRVVAGAERGE